MTANTTGRTVNRWLYFLFSDGTAMRNIPVTSVSVVGLVYDEVDLTAYQDAVKGALPNHPDAPISITGPMDTTAVAASPAISGGHTVLAGMAGVATPRSLDVQFGMRHAWESGEPQFGITATATSGYIVTSYTVDPSSMTFSATFKLIPASSVPAWGTTAEAVS